MLGNGPDVFSVNGYQAYAHRQDWNIDSSHEMATKGSMEGRTYYVGLF